MTPSTRWCSICQATDKPIGILSVAWKLKESNHATSMGGSRYTCEQCAQTVFKMSVDAPVKAKPEAAKE